MTHKKYYKNYSYSTHTEENLTEVNDNKKGVVWKDKSGKYPTFNNITNQDKLERLINSLDDEFIPMDEIKVINGLIFKIKEWFKRKKQTKALNKKIKEERKKAEQEKKETEKKERMVEYIERLKKKAVIKDPTIEATREVSKNIEILDDQFKQWEKHKKGEKI